MNVFKFNHWPLIIALALLTSCWNGNSFQVTLSEIETMNIPANKRAHGFKLWLKGEMPCDVQLVFLQGNQDLYKYNFSGSVDTLIWNEWYYQDLGFKLIKEDCDVSNVKVKFKLLTS